MLMGVGIGMAAPEEQATLVSVQVALGRIEGVLSTVVTEHSRRIEDNARETSKVRVDFEAGLKAINLSMETGRTEGTKVLRELDGRIASNTSGVAEAKEDIKEIRDRQNNSWNKVAVILGPIIGGAAFFWPIIHKQ